MELLVSLLSPHSTGMHSTIYILTHLGNRGLEWRKKADIHSL
jgi:hypothetical protein